MWVKFSELSAEDRNALPDSAFAFIDKDGNRHLPINDANHVRVALARVNQTKGLSGAPQQRALAKIRKAAQRYGVSTTSAEAVSYGPGGNLDWDDGEEPDESEDGITPSGKTAGAEKKPTSDDDGDEDGQDDDDDGDGTQGDEGTPPAAGPGMTDVHVPGPMNQKKRSPALKRLASSAREHFKTGRLMAADQFESLYRKAIGGAGGVARKADELCCSECTGPDCGCCEDCATMGESEMHDHIEGSAHFSAKDGTGIRMFLPFKGGEWIEYIPAPGSWDSPKYGKIVITPERNQAFVQNFNDGVYQDKLPIDAEHETKLSGALGWVEQMRVNANGSVGAFVDWTDRGETMLAAKRFRYFSPEWYDAWKDPASEKVHKDVAIGGALTERPFFKKSSLQPLLASEGGFETVDNADNKESQKMAGESKTFAELEAEVVAKDAELVQLTEERDEAKAKVDEATKAAEVAQAASVTLTERISAIELADKRRQFTEVAREYPGETAKHVALMETMTDEQLKAYNELETGSAEKIKAGSLMQASGVSSQQEQVGNVVSQVVKAAEAAVKAAKASGTSLTMSEAVADAWTPEAYAEYLKETGA